MVRFGIVAVTLLTLGVMSAGCGAESPPVAKAAPESRPTPGGEFSYEPYGTALIEDLDATGRVDYAALKANPGELERFLANLAALDPALYGSWDDDAKIALWINAYNALTLKAIIDHYPIKASLLKSVLYPKNSIRQIPGVWTDLTFRVMGREVTLDRIEHEILRAEFDEPRIHMALVCAALSCPPLRWEPYTGERLDVQLEDQTVRFIGSPEKLRIDRDKGRVELSSIFKWFGDDFVSMYGPDEGFEGRDPALRAVLNFVAIHLEGSDREFVEHADYRVKYVDYDWTLNETPGSES